VAANTDRKELAMGNALVGDMSAWSGMFMDLHRQIGDGSLTRSQLQAFLNHRNPFAITNVSEEWQAFYQKYCRLAVDFSNVIIPEGIGFDRILFIPEGLTIKMIVEAYTRKGITVDIASDMDGQLKGRNVRETNSSYAVRLRDRQEADEELKNRSFNQLKADGINSITLLERLVYGLKFWVETEGDHLDVNNWTLCAGSQHAGGHVPLVICHGDPRKVCVNWCLPVFARDRLRSRQVVSN
jgi:hypothetical protein